MANILQIKRGVTAKRMAYTPAAGEFVQDLTTGKVYIGDGNTPGGIEVNSVNYQETDVALLTANNIFTGKNIFAGGVFSPTAPAVTADSTAVNTISKTFTGQVVSAWKNVDFSSYKVTGDNRTHFGVIAQDIQAAFTAAGINAIDYGLIETVDGLLTVRLEECLILEAYCSRLKVERKISATGDATWSVDFDGESDESGVLTLADTGVNAGTYKSVTVDTKGRVIAGAEVITGLVTAATAAGTANAATTNTNTYLNVVEKVGTATASAGTSTQISGAGTVTVASDAAGKLTITGSQSVTGNAGTATRLQTSRNIAITGDATWDVDFTGAANVTGALTLNGTGVAAGTYAKVTVDTKGRVTAGAAMVATDIPSLDTSKLTSGTLPVARGGTGLTAAVQGGVVYGASTTTNAYTPAGQAGQVLVSNGTAAPTWQGLTLQHLPEAAVKRTVRAATTANITLSGVQTIDGVSVVAGDRVLVKNQTAAGANGLYIAATGAWTRAPDADLNTEVAGAIVNVDFGTANGGQSFTTDFKASDTLGTTAMSWFRVLDTSMAGSTAPKAAGSAAVGVAERYAREDHVHPLQTTVSGNAGTATRLATARTISLTGDVSGSANFDGSANASINVTIAGLGANNGIATLDATGKVPSSQLPSYVDDVLEYTTTSAFPATGEAGKIYVETTGNTTYRWSGTAYVKITSGEVSSVAGKTGVVTLVKGDVGLGNVDNTADSSKVVASAAKLTTARTINGVAFDGTANITVVDATKAPIASPTFTGVPAGPTASTATSTTQLATTAFVQAVNSADTGSSATALTLKTARNIAIAGAVTGSASFNGGSNITINANFGDVDLGVL